MPTYAFECRDCGHKFDELVRSFGATAPCPKCGSKNATRQVSAPTTRIGDRLRDKLAENRAKCSSPPGSSFG